MSDTGLEWRDVRTNEVVSFPNYTPTIEGEILTGSHDGNRFSIIARRVPRQSSELATGYYWVKFRADGPVVIAQRCTISETYPWQFIGDDGIYGDAEVEVIERIPDYAGEEP